MGDDVKIDKTNFHDRLSSFLAQWKTDKRTGNSLFNGADSIVIVMGKSEDGQGFHKNNGFQFWLLGYEFPATLFVITQEAIYILTTKKKATYLESLKGGKVPVEILVRGKDVEENAKLFERLLDIIKTAGNRLGVLAKDPSTGPFVDEWKKALGDISKDVEEVDITPAISEAALTIKDERELRAMRDASRASSGLLKGYFVEEMSKIVDEEEKVTNKALANKIFHKLDDAKFFQKLKVSETFDPSQLDWAYNPVVQSGGKYDLKFTSDPDDSNLHAGTIIAALGVRYASYASLVARTYLVDPNKHQEKMYEILLSVHATVLKELKDGVSAGDIYNKALAFLKSTKPELEKHFVKSVGVGIGLEARDNTITLNAKSTRTLRDGMTLQITTGFTDLQNPKSQDKKSGVYSLVLADTVRVTSGDSVVFTRHAPSDWNEISFRFEEDEPEPEAKPKAKKDSRVGAVASSNITKTRLRGDRKQADNSEKEAARREHQKELHAKMQKEGKERYGVGAGSLNGTEEKRFKRFESYKRDTQFPTRVKDLVICVDSKSSTVVLPIMGRPVPFHINTIKNASRTDEGEYSYLRINFLSPGQGVGRKEDQKPFEDPTAHFVRSLTFRSKDVNRMEDIANEITEMRKMAVRKENEKKEMEDVVEQDKLIEIRNRKPARLENIHVRPALETKRVAGTLEIHQNGLRYHHALREHQRIDILFSNIKHLFFQPSVQELIVIIHIHLINPILVGKRKTKDVQFYREATEMAFDETGNRKRKHRYGDEEEFEAEQEERRRRAALDREFKAFAEKISDAGRNENIQVDVPFRELGFNGVPSRASVWIQPTTDCLVQLTEPPFLVITLSEIEIVHLERVQFGLKNFDMVVVYKDFNRAPTHINTIPVESLDPVKDWLDSCEIPFSEGPLNLNWATIMKTVTADPHQFFQDGGWGFLSTESDSEDEVESEEESAFEISDEDLLEASESSEDDSEFDDDASAEASDEEVSEDEGEDWDELEKKAKKKDRESGLDDEDTKKKGRRR